MLTADDEFSKMIKKSNEKKIMLLLLLEEEEEEERRKKKNKNKENDEQKNKQGSLLCTTLRANKQRHNNHNNHNNHNHDNSSTKVNAQKQKQKQQQQQQDEGEVNQHAHHDAVADLAATTATATAAHTTTTNNKEEASSTSREFVVDTDHQEQQEQRARSRISSKGKSSVNSSYSSSSSEESSLSSFETFENEEDQEIFLVFLPKKGVKGQDLQEEEVAKVLLLPNIIQDIKKQKDQAEILWNSLDDAASSRHGNLSSLSSSSSTSSSSSIESGFFEQERRQDYPPPPPHHQLYSSFNDTVRISVDLPPSLPFRRSAEEAGGADSNSDDHGTNNDDAGSIGVVDTTPCLPSRGGGGGGGGGGFCISSNHNSDDHDDRRISTIPISSSSSSSSSSSITTAINGILPLEESHHHHRHHPHSLLADEEDDEQSDISSFSSSSSSSSERNSNNPNEQIGKHHDEDRLLVAEVGMKRMRKTKQDGIQQRTTVLGQLIKKQTSNNTKTNGTGIIVRPISIHTNNSRRRGIQKSSSADFLLGQKKNKTNSFVMTSHHHHHHHRQNHNGSTRTPIRRNTLSHSSMTTTRPAPLQRVVFQRTSSADFLLMGRDRQYTSSHNNPNEQIGKHHDEDHVLAGDDEVGMKRMRKKKQDGIQQRTTVLGQLIMKQTSNNTKTNSTGIRPSVHASNSRPGIQKSSSADFLLGQKKNKTNSFVTMSHHHQQNHNRSTRAPIRRNTFTHSSMITARPAPLQRAVFQRTSSADFLLMGRDRQYTSSHNPVHPRSKSPALTNTIKCSARELPPVPKRSIEKMPSADDLLMRNNRKERFSSKNKRTTNATFDANRGNVIIQQRRDHLKKILSLRKLPKERGRSASFSKLFDNNINNTNQTNEPFIDLPAIAIGDTSKMYSKTKNSSKVNELCHSWHHEPEPSTRNARI